MKKIVIVLVAVVLVIAGFNVYGNIKDVRDAQNSYTVLLDLYKQKDFETALDRMENIYNELNRGADKETDEKVDKLYEDIEVALYAKTKESGADKKALLALYETYYPKGKYLSTIKADAEKPDLPSSLLFLKGLEPTKNSNGTYSFKGSFTHCTTSYYGASVSVYIKGLNGSSFSSGDPTFFGITYQRDDGTYGAVVSDLMYESWKITGKVFEFFYDKDGNLVQVKQIT